MSFLGPVIGRACACALIGGLAFLAGETALAAGWVDERSAGPFTCRADFSLTGYEGLFSELAQLQSDLVQLLHVEPAREPIELCLFRSETTYRNYLAARFPDVPFRKALFIKGRGPGRVFTFVSKELATNVRHEGTHALLHASLPMVPLWLDEGLAEYFEVPAAERASANPHWDKVTWGLRLGMPLHLVPLETKRDLAGMSTTDYRHSWAWVHFMLHGPPEAHDELVRYLGDIRASTPPGRLSERLERRLPGAEKRLVQHFKAFR